MKKGRTSPGFIRHIHPVSIPLKALELKSTWALGGISLILVMLLMGSGALMLFVYRPFPAYAYASVLELKNQYSFGQMIRNMHYFAANLLVVTVFAHMLRVFFTGGYQGQRRLNWIVGVYLFCCVLLSCFTGYLLPWDQTAYWAVTICINMFGYIPGGDILKGLFVNSHGVSEKTLQLFFTLHTTGIPSLMILFMGIHFWKIRKAKGVVTSGLNLLTEAEKPVMVKTNPHLLLREAVATLILVAFIMVLSFFFDAPLGDMANAGLSPNPAKAPWYFSGFQELLLHFHPFFAVFLIPFMLLCTLFYLPFIRFKHRDIQDEGVWFISSRGKKIAVAAVLFAMILASAFILVDEIVPDVQTWLPGVPVILSEGVIPFGLAALLVLLFHFWMKKQFRLSDAEAFQTSAVFLIITFMIFTLTCVWFRGEGMKLCFLGGCG